MMVKGGLTVFRLFERLLGFIVVAPPLYLLFRFIRWYARQGREEDSTT
jgi:hypothetical protein